MEAYDIREQYYPLLQALHLHQIRNKVKLFSFCPFESSGMEVIMCLLLFSTKMKMEYTFDGKPKE